MAVTKESEIVSFDIDSAVRMAGDLVGEDLLVATEYTPDRCQVLSLSDRLIDAWGNTDDSMDVGEAVHRYMHGDFAEGQLVADLYPSVEETSAFATDTDRMITVCVVSGEAGMYVSLMRGTETTPLVEAVKAILED